MLPLPSRGSTRTLQPVAAFSGGEGSRLQSALRAPLAPRVQSVSCAARQYGRGWLALRARPYSCRAGGADRQEICRAVVHRKAVPPAGSRALGATRSQLRGGEHLKARPSPHRTLLRDPLMPPLKEPCPSQQGQLAAADAGSIRATTLPRPGPQSPLCGCRGGRCLPQTETRKSWRERQLLCPAGTLLLQQRCWRWRVPRAADPGRVRAGRRDQGRGHCLRGASGI